MDGAAVGVPRGARGAAAGHPVVLRWDPDQAAAGAEDLREPFRRRVPLVDAPVRGPEQVDRAAGARGVHGQGQGVRVRGVEGEAGAVLADGRADDGQPGVAALGAEDAVVTDHHEAAVVGQAGRGDRRLLGRHSGAPLDRVVRQLGYVGRHTAPSLASERI